ncbi:MAG: replicative DNA helicase [bacterium]|nr:replicative DNA helicase [bacterium]MDE0289284.1 replicative DNA helicase [bacterium]MDE0439673.1 replicative DNA helicase [bacterium]
MTMPERVTGPTPARRHLAPPHSVEAEESVIGAMLRSRPAADEVFERLTVEDLYVPAHRTIFEAMRRLYDENQPIDTVTVVDRLHRGGELEAAGGPGFVVRFWDAVPSAANVGYYAGVVEEHSLRRRMLDASNQISALAMNLDSEVDMVLDQAEQAMLGVAERRVGGGMEALGNVLAQVLERLEKVESEGLDVTGLPTGLVDLDRKLGGLQPSTLVVVAGRPGMGKSALAMNIASHVAMHHGPVAYFSLEMSPTEIAYRWLGSEARVDSMKLRSGLGGGDHSRVWSSLVEATSKLYKVPLHADEGSRTVTDIRAKCRRLKRKTDLKLVVVDYMQLMQGRSRENRQQEIAEISLNLKALARELDVPVIAVSQLNRALESRQDKRPQLGDLRESGAIEQDADVVLMIYRDEYYNKDTRELGIAEIIIAKQRAGPTGMIKTTFADKYTRFDNLPHGYTNTIGQQG